MLHEGLVGSRGNVHLSLIYHKLRLIIGMHIDSVLTISPLLSWSLSSRLSLLNWYNTLSNNRLLFLLRCSLFLSLLLFFTHHLFELVFVLLSEDACSLLSFGNKVVRSGQIVEFVPLDIVFASFDVNLVVLVEKLHDVHVDWNRVLTYNYAILFIWIHLVVPWMASDVFNCSPLGRIRVEDNIEEILCFITQETWHLIVCLEDLLVQLLSVLVLKRKISTDHSIQNDST